jgi:hypothetical protein
MRGPPTRHGKKEQPAIPTGSIGEQMARSNLRAEQMVSSTQTTIERMVHDDRAEQGVFGMVRRKDIIGPIIALLTEAEGHCARPCELLTQLEQHGLELFPQATRAERLRSLNWHLWTEANHPGRRVQHAGWGRYRLVHPVIKGKAPTPGAIVALKRLAALKPDVIYFEGFKTMLSGTIAEEVALLRARGVSELEPTE